MADKYRPKPELKYYVKPVSLPRHRYIHHQHQSPSNRRAASRCRDRLLAGHSPLPTRSGRNRIRRNGGRRWSASIRSVLEKAGIGGERIAAVGLTGQMHGLVLLDEAGKFCVPPSCGTTSARRANAMRSISGSAKRSLSQITGNVALTGFTAPKILWVKENEPEVYAQSEACSAAQGLHPL